MSLAKAVRENAVLIVGLTAPIVLLLVLLVAGSAPGSLADPPRHNLVFSAADYSPGSQALPVTPRLVVKDGTLKVQYTKLVQQPPGYGGGGWKKLYLYDASTKKIRQLALPVPASPESIEGMREETLEATRTMTLDTSLEAPDGYQLTFGGDGRGGVLGDLFWRSGDRYGPRLKKGGSSVPLMSPDSQVSFGGGGVEFVAWVVRTEP